MLNTIHTDYAEEISKFLAIKEFVNFEDYITPKKYKKRMDVFTDFISDLGYDKDNMKKFLESINGIISGSTLLRAIINETQDEKVEWEVYDLDIFTTDISKEEIIRFFENFFPEKMIRDITNCGAPNYKNITNLKNVFYIYGNDSSGIRLNIVTTTYTNIYEVIENNIKKFDLDFVKNALWRENGEWKLYIDNQQSIDTRTHIGESPIRKERVRKYEKRGFKNMKKKDKDFNESQFNCDNIYIDNLDFNTNNDFNFN